MDGEQAVADTRLGVENLACVYGSLQLEAFVQPDARGSINSQGRSAKVAAAFLNELLGDQVRSERARVEAVRESAVGSLLGYVCVVGVSRFTAMSLVASFSSSLSLRPLFRSGPSAAEHLECG